MSVFLFFFWRECDFWEFGKMFDLLDTEIHFKIIGGKYILYDRFFSDKSKVFSEKFAKKRILTILRVGFIYPNLMKNIIKIWFLSFFSLLVGILGSSWANGVPGQTNSERYGILNQQEQNILDPMKDQKDTWRKGAQDAIRSSDGNDKHRIDNLINSDAEITTQDDAQNRLLQVIWRLVNYALGLVSLISFVLLLVAGFTMVTNAGDDKAQEEGKKTLLKIARAIAGIAVSWLIISFIFWLIEQIVGK